MGLFGQYANVYKSVQDTLRARTRTLSNATGDILANVENVSSLKPWIRISSAVNDGLIIGTGISLDPAFDNLYGTSTRSGKIGDNFLGVPVFESSPVQSRGYRPSPIIESIGIQNGSEGLSRNLKFQIKCFSLPQLDTITKYFLEPRYYLLAEWGWNTPAGYSGLAKIENQGITNGVCEMITYMNLRVLKEKRSKSSGHYDAFLGVITGGGISFGDDETYIIDVEVTTQGEIPAYLQQNKGTVVSTSPTSVGAVAKSSAIFNIEKDIETALRANNFGKSLFLYMFNDLPAQKQIQAVKNLQFQTITEVSKEMRVDNNSLVSDPTMLYWCQEFHYLNMNTSYRDKLRETLIEGAEITVPGLEDEIKYNGEQPLISDSRYIRMELAWKILNEIGKNDVITEDFNCSGNNIRVPNYKISIDSTICRAHKHMFSVNREFLFIPNEYCPDFGLEDFLVGAPDATPLRMNGGTIQTRAAGNRPFGLPNSYVFPQFQSLGKKIEDGAISFGEQFDDSYRLLDKPALSWGYLKDLFINFDFFCECINRNGALIKDVAIDILNGLSQGCNMFWDFQIVEIGSTDKNDVGIQKLVVVDANFTGIPKGGKLTDGTDSAQNVLSLQTIGVNSPFLDINMKLEIKGALGNQVMAQRGGIYNTSDNSSVTIEDKVENFYGLFSRGANDNLERKINEVLATARNNIEGDPNSAGGEDSDVELIIGSDINGEIIQYRGITYYGEPARTVSVGTSFVIYPAIPARQKVDEARRDYAASTLSSAIESNWIMFMEKAAVFPRINDPSNIDFASGTFFNIDSNDAYVRTLVVGAWEDSQLLRQVYEFDMRDPDDTRIKRFEPRTNPGYLPIEVEFTIHGISGFKVGDMIHFKDLPHVYREKIFTVMNVAQVIDGDIWKTTVTTACRNLVAPGYKDSTMETVPSGPLPPLPGADPDDVTGGRGVPFTTTSDLTLPEFEYDPLDPFGIRRRFRL
jgi:hypothetical protein